MLTLPDYEFQFQYEDSNTPLLTAEYRPANDSNRVRVDKVIRDTGELLEGAALQIERTDHPEAPESGKWEVVDRWISTRQPHYSKGLRISPVGPHSVYHPGYRGTAGGGDD